MLRKKMTVNIPAGLHLRPISVLCNRSIDFKSSITLKIRDKSVNAKSVLGILSACVKSGDEIELICDGPDEAEAMDTLSHMIQDELKDLFLKK
jgi:phosphocarrier protein